VRRKAGPARRLSAKVAAPPESVINLNVDSHGDDT
jgi:hypothetical protein